MKSGPSRSLKRKRVLDIMATAKDDSYEPWTVNELTSLVESSSETVRRRLKELENIGQVKSKKPGARSKVWWVPSEYR